MGNGVHIPPCQLRAEACDHSEGVGRDCLAEDMGTESTQQSTSRLRVVEVMCAICLVYSSLGDQSGFEQGSTRVIGLKKRLPDVKFDGTGIPA